MRPQPRNSRQSISHRGATALLVASILLAGSVASADVKQPDGTTVPTPKVGCYSGKPGGLAAVFACACTTPGVCNIGKACPGGSTSCDPGTNGTCESTLWHTVNGDPCIPSNLSGLDPVKDAATKPQTFRPVCGLTFTLLAREAIFRNAFGWYNVTGKKPDAKDLHVLVDCTTPLKKATPLALLSDPAYKGGDIGFFLVTPESHSAKGQCAGGDCCATVARALKGEGRIYFSQPQFNPDNTGPSSYIHLLTYRSRIAQNKFYFAWEDTYGGSTNEFTDFVTAVGGISCSGAGLRCDTGKPGVCNLGVTQCQGNAATPVCVAATKPASERCDGQDNDCNGLVDDHAPCPTGKVCHQGACVPHCKAFKEFACQVGYECDETRGICVDKACKSVVCKTGEICRAGACRNGCDGAVCPRGQVCQAGACVDLCAGVACGANEICKLGVCVQKCGHCGGLNCSGGLTCDKSSGDCVDASCAGGCSAGSTCIGGACKGPCDGVKCPGGGVCKAGVCGPPGVTQPGALLPDLGGGAGSADGGAGGSGDGGGGNGNANGFDADTGGCGCATSGVGDGGGPAALALLLLAFALRARRRRR